MKDWKIWGLGLTSVVLALSGCSNSTAPGSTGTAAKGNTPSLSGDPIVIGLDEDSTGPGASYSTIAGKTIRDTVDEINEKGGILGRPVKLIVGNDESDPTKAPSVIRKLIDDGAQVIVAATATTAIVQAKPTVQQSQTVFVSPIGINQAIVTQPDADYMYALANPLSDFVKVYCGAIEKQGYKKLAVLSDASITIEGVNKMLLPGLDKCIQQVASEKAPVDSADLNAQVARIKAAGPDLVLVSSVGGNFEVLAQNTLAQQLPNVQRFSLASIGNQPNSWKLVNPGALKGLVFMGSLDPNNPRTKALGEMLSKRRGGTYTVTAYDAQAYDGMYLLKAAIEKAGGTDKAKLKGAMDSLTKVPATFSQASFTLSFTPTKHLGSDGLCGLVLTEFGQDNKPKGAWDKYQAPC